MCLLLCLPFIAYAQDDKKYLEGAVPVIDEKVTFTTEIKAPLNKQKIYEVVQKYLQKRFATNEKFPGCRLSITDAEKGDLVASGEEYLVFSNSALSLDRSRIYYIFHAECNDGSCQLTMNRIRYLYDENRDGGERYKAEEWITDDMALNKAKTKLSRMSGKFRSKTIDLKDELFDGIEAALASSLLKKNETPKEDKKEAIKEETNKAVRVISAPVENTQTTTQATVTRTDKTSVKAKETPIVQKTEASIPSKNKMILKKEKTPAATEVNAIAKGKAEPKVQLTNNSSEVLKGYIEINASEIPGNFYEMISKDWMLITSGNKDKFNMMTASWGTFGQLYGKPVLTCFVLPSRYTYQLIEKNDTYTLTFFRSNYKDALNYCGKHSGRDEDKVKGSGLTPISTPDGTMAFSEAWLIIECKKMLAQSLNPEALKNNKLKEQWEGKAMHKMYIGEILHIWMK